jgi:hypothetical protein
LFLGIASGGAFVFLYVKDAAQKDKASLKLEQRKVPFNQKDWQKSSFRETMFSDLIASNRLLKLSEKQLVSLLGPPDNTHDCLDSEKAGAQKYRCFDYCVSMLGLLKGLHNNSELL